MAQVSQPLLSECFKYKHLKYYSVHIKDSRALNRGSKFKIYRSLLRPVVTYGHEAWTLASRVEQYL